MTTILYLIVWGMNNFITAVLCTVLSSSSEHILLIILNEGAFSCNLSSDFWSIIQVSLPCDAEAADEEREQEERNEKKE